MPLTPADVRNKQFSTTRLRPGYDEEEVDAFLDEVEAELDRLIQENEELRAKLAECLRGKVPAMAAPIVEPKPDMAPMSPEPPRPPEPRPEAEPAPTTLGALGAQPPAPPPAPSGPPAPSAPASPMGPAMPVPSGAAMPAASGGEDNMDTAARVLALAQQTADQAIADARREADETMSRARREAEDIVGKARHQAEQIVSEARNRAETLERDAQERHRQAMGSLVQQREELERKVDDLRAFEREYRSRLKEYLGRQLGELEAGAAEGSPFPTGPNAVVPNGTGPHNVVSNGTGPQPVQSALPHNDVRNGQPGGPPTTTGPTPFPRPEGESAQHAPQQGGTGGFPTSDNPPHDRR